MGIQLISKGDFNKVTGMLENFKEDFSIGILDKYGKKGVKALQDATPIDTGKTASSWYYKIDRKKGSAILSFCNSNINKGVPIAIILEYGHGTSTGGWVEGRNYITPTIKPILDELAEKVWEEVKYV